MKAQILDTLTLVVGCLAFVVPALAGTPDVSPQSPLPTQPGTTSATAPACGPSSKATLSKADHIRLAAEHLEAAGLKEDAERLRHPDESPFALVNVRMIELSLTKLAEVSAEPYGGAKDMSVLDLLRKLQLADQSPEHDNVLKSPDPKLLALIEALLKDHLAIARAEPTILAVSGRPAYVLDGGEIGYAEKDAQGNEHTNFKEYGTRIDAVATHLPDNRIHLDLRLDVSEPDAANSIGGIPAIKKRGIETGLDLRLGQTIIIGGLVEEHRVAYAYGKPKKIGHRTNKIECFVLVRTEGVPKETAAKPTTSR